MEQIYRQTLNGSQLRPFSLSADVCCGHYSTPLQRAIVDFAADDSFNQAAEKLKEHYGIEVPQSATRSITFHHATQMEEEMEIEDHLPEGGVAQILAETDGSMVPIVTISEEKKGDSQDGRKGRVLEWKEGRLSMARAEGKVKGRYNATMAGVEQTGNQLLDCVIKAGGGLRSKLHFVGDAAAWILRQVKEKFGEETSYLIDFYHVTEYVAAAGERIGGKQSKEWISQQKERLKRNEAEKVIEELKEKEKRCEGADKEAIEKCKRYLSNHLKCLDYKGAIEGGLPIGSGEIESGHRWIIQARLKLSGAWWKEDNAEKMLALRIVRANGEWQSYWDKRRQAAA